VALYDGGIRMTTDWWDWRRPWAAGFDRDTTNGGRRARSVTTWAPTDQRIVVEGMIEEGERPSKIASQRLLSFWDFAGRAFGPNKTNTPEN